jgi:spore maturation protein CgeB
MEHMRISAPAHAQLHSKQNQNKASIINKLTSYPVQNQRVFEIFG